jgi:CO dehydrogenase/acetyl-CoA synthase beta subunit
MELFEKIISSFQSFLDEQPDKRTWFAENERPWPAGGGRNIVLKEDMGLELGSPGSESLSCLLWTENLAHVADRRITLVGPDFPESTGRSLPFGKVVLAGVEGFNEDDTYDRHKELDFLRYDLDLKGFMMRAVSQYMREWCRISRDALQQGLSAKVLGSSLIALFQKMPYVKAVEVILFTSSTSDVSTVREITAPAEKIIAAMNKMAAEMDFECGTCDYQDVCDEADGLKNMRNRLKENKPRTEVTRV